MSRFTPDYSAFRLMTEPAKASAQLWRLGLGVICIIFTFFVMRSGLNVVLFQVVTQDEGAVRLAEAIYTGATPLGALIALGSISVFALAAYLAVETVHARSGLTLLGPIPLAKRQVQQVLPGLAALSLIVIALAYLAQTDPILPGLPLPRWLAFLPLTITVVLLQTASEEFLFRGYLQSQLGAMTSNPLVWMVVPSVIFALLHWSPATYGDQALWPVIFAAVFGMLAADLTARSGTLGPAIALHFINNFGVIAVMAPMNDFSGLALVQFPFTASDAAAMQALFPMDLVTLFAFWLACRVALQR